MKRGEREENDVASITSLLGALIIGVAIVQRF
jgi:hypothetical protein